MAAELLAETGIAISYEEYALSAAHLVKYDDESRQTIGGVPVLERMHLGVFEEWAEIFGGDSVSVEDSFGYCRVDALRGGLTYTQLFRGMPGGEEQLSLHTKEFGDNLWYITNYLACYGITLDEAMNDVDYGFTYAHSYGDDKLERAETSNTYPSELASFVENGHNLFSHMGEVFARTQEGVLPDNTAKHTLKQLTRLYVESMSVLAATTFDVTLDEIMVANLEKISGRWKNDTVLGHGDKR